MIDNQDCSTSTLRLLIGEALKHWSSAAILKLLSDSDSIVRTAAARELQLRNEQQIFNYVASLVNSNVNFEREIGAFVLGQLGTPELPFKEQSLPLLIKLLEDKSNEVKIAALTSLGHLGGKAVLDAALLTKIKSFSDDSSEDVRLSCAFALGSFGKSSGVLDVLQKMLLDSDINVVEWAEVSIEIINERN